MVGKTLGHYDVARKLGEGGMGEVYVAHDTKLNREVALKVLPADMAADSERRARFEREARAVAALNHPNIVTIFSVEEAHTPTGAVHFLTMELVEGRTLTELIPDRGLALPKLFELALQLTDAVATAHQMGITHRDLKPDNIMVDEAGRLKVLDFGLAKLRDDARAQRGAGTQLPTASITQEGRILGTAAYMSPEQAEGKPVDPRSDVFSLGVILYEMSTGRRPFQGDTVISTISSILRDEPKSITDVKHNVPRHLGRIAKRALTKDPQRRYQSALELRNELEELKREIESGELEVGPVAAASPGPRSRTGLWLGLGAVTLAGAALVFSILRSPDTSTAPGDSTAAAAAGSRMTRITEGGRTGSVSISPDGKYLAYAMGNDESKGSLRLRQLATGSDVEILPPDNFWPWGTEFSPDGTYIYFNRGVFREARSDAYRVPVLGGEPRRIVEDVGSEVNFSPDGERIVFRRGVRGTAEARLILAHADGSGETVLATREDPEGFSGPAAWSADGQHILATVSVWPQGLPHGQHVAIPVSGGEEKPIGPPWKSKGRPTPLLDGSGFVFTGGKSWFSGDQLWYYPLPDGPARPITADLAAYDNPSITADGTMLVVGRTESWSSIWVAPADDLAAMRPRIPDSQSRPGGEGMDWTPAGDLVYTVIGSDRIGLQMAPADGGPSRPVSEGDHIEAGPALTSDGRVVFVTERGGGINIWIRDLSGENLRQLTSGLTGEPHLTPDDEWVFYISFAEGINTLWKVPLEGGEPVQVVDTPITGYDISPSGTKLAVRFVHPETNRYESKILTLDGELIRSIEGIPSQPMWGADDETLMIVKPLEKISNLWAWPLDGSEPRQLTAFDDPDIGICDRRWSRDRKQFAVERCRSDRNAVTISNFR